jgi:hypothetical protein
LKPGRSLRLAPSLAPALSLALAAALVLALAAGAAHAQSGTGAGLGGGPGYGALEPLNGGETITSIVVEVEPRDAPGAEALKSLVLKALGFQPGDQWDPILGAAVRARLEALPQIQSLAFAGRVVGGGVGRQLIVTVRAALIEAVEPERGILVSGDLADLPVLYRQGGRYLQMILNGGFCVYSDGNPWFDTSETCTRGNPLVENPAVGTGDRASWAEGFAQVGFGGVTPMGDEDLYGFGAVSAIGPGSYGRDIFRDDPRATFDLELLFAGLLYAPKDQRHRFKISAGRQNFTLNNGFLISQFGSQWNAGPRPGVYISPRTAHDFAFLASGKLGRWAAQAFWLDPDEYEQIEDHTRVAGLNLARETAGLWSGNASLISIPESDFRYRFPDGLARRREGLWTVAAMCAGRQRRMHPTPGLNPSWRISGTTTSRWLPGLAMLRLAGSRAPQPGRQACATGLRPSLEMIRPPAFTSASTPCIRVVSISGCRASRSTSCSLRPIVRRIGFASTSCRRRRST